MSLTTDDLSKIEELFMRLFGERLKKVEIELEKAKDERSDIKDMLVGIRNELDTEHEFRYAKL